MKNNNYVAFGWEEDYSAQTYFDLPIDQRTREVWYWPAPWYKLPSALRFEEWDKLYRKLKQEFPVQYYIRQGWWDKDWHYSICRFYQSIKDFCRKWIYRTFKPLNTEIRATIPTREWHDKVTIIRDVLFAIVVDFVEKEGGAQIIETPPDVSETERDAIISQNIRNQHILNIYDWIKTERPKLEIKLSNAYPKFVNWDAFTSSNKSYDELYGEVNKIDKLIEETDANHLKWIVENRGYFWT